MITEWLVALIVKFEISIHDKLLMSDSKRYDRFLFNVLRITGHIKEKLRRSCE
jgi:hypothetical protein